MPDHERDRLGRHLLRRHDQVALVLPIGVVDDDHDRARADVLHRLRDRRERRMSPIASCLRSSSSCSLSDPVGRVAVHETFHVLRDHIDLQVHRGRRAPPFPAWSRRACAGSGRSRIPSPCERGHRQADAVHGDRSLLHRCSGAGPRARRRREHARRRRRRGSIATTSPTPSTWPWTRWPPSRAASVTGRSRFTGSPGTEPAEASCARGSPPTGRTPGAVGPGATTVRHTPFTATDAPRSLSATTMRQPTTSRHRSGIEHGRRAPQRSR